MLAAARLGDMRARLATAPGITLKPRVERYKSLCALNTSPPREQLLVLRPLHGREYMVGTLSSIRNNAQSSQQDTAQKHICMYIYIYIYIYI